MAPQSLATSDCAIVVLPSFVGRVPFLVSIYDLSLHYLGFTDGRISLIVVHLQRVNSPRKSRRVQV